VGLGPSPDTREDVWGILLAAGSGSRFGDTKQFVEVKGHRLVDLSLRTTESVCGGVVLVLPEGRSWDGEPVAAVVSGGTTRLESARRGLAEVPSSARLVLVHDAAHPLASRDLFLRLIEATEDDHVDAALPVLPAVDTIMRADNAGLIETIPREGLVTVQTPQAFKADVLRSLHEAGGEGSDDSVLAQRAGLNIALVAGEIANLHVTTKTDFATLARLLDAPR
jgi:2-C-methyl-D-erythritol 4-phosphate cytidylyltransferase